MVDEPLIAEQQPAAEEPLRAEPPRRRRINLVNEDRRAPSRSAVTQQIDERPLAPGRVVVGALLLGSCVAFLPSWDGLSDYEMMRSLGGSGLAASVRGVPGLGKAALSVAAGILLARALYRPGLSVRRRANWSARRLIFGIGVLLTVGYLAWSAVSTALTRSQAVNFWKVCETWQPTALDKRLMEYDEKNPHLRRPPAFDGPNLPNGDPCVLESERRSIHQEGTLSDGIRQIQGRFPKDRQRVLQASLGVLFALVLSGWLLRPARRSPVKSD
jgi:hypothetical protein